MDNQSLPPRKERSWRQFQRVALDRKRFRKHVSKVESATTRHAHRFVVKRISNIRFVRQRIIAWFIAVALILGGIGAQFIWDGRTNMVQADTAGGTYAEGIVGKLETLNPLQASSSPEIAASRLMFSSLYRYDDTGTLHPDAAKSMSIDEDGGMYTVKLRDDILWHDGKKLTAEDVVFTIETIKNPDSLSRSSLHVSWRDIDVKVMDEYTVQFNLSTVATFPHALTFPIVPKHLLASVAPSVIGESSFAVEPVGSGPFVFKLLQNSDSINEHKTVHMSANDDYYLGKPRLSRFEVHAYRDEDALLSAIRSTEVTAAVDIDSADLASVNQKLYDIESHTLNNGVYLLMNNNHSVLKNADVRRAMQKGINTDAVREAAGAGVAELGLPFLNSHYQGSDIPAAPKYNQADAKSMLDKAGWKMSGGVRKKGNVELKLNLKTTTDNPQYERATKELARQIRELGIKVDVTVVDRSAPGANFIQETLQQRNYDLLLYELQIGADPDVYPYWHSSQLGVSGYNWTSYSNKTSDLALVSALDQVDQQLRRAKYVTFAKQWLRDAPAVGLYQQASSYVRFNRAEAMDEDARLVTSTDRYANILEWTVSKELVYKTP